MAWFTSKSKIGTGKVEANGLLASSLKDPVYLKNWLELIKTAGCIVAALATAASGAWLYMKSPSQPGTSISRTPATPIAPQPSAVIAIQPTPQPAQNILSSVSAAEVMTSPDAAVQPASPVRQMAGSSSASYSTPAAPLRNFISHGNKRLPLDQSKSSESIKPLTVHLAKLDAGSHVKLKANESTALNLNIEMTTFFRMNKGVIKISKDGASYIPKGTDGTIREDEELAIFTGRPREWSAYALEDADMEVVRVAIGDLTHKG